MCAFTMCACAIIIFPAHFASYFHSTFLRSGFHSCPHPLLKIHITGDQRSAIIALSCLPSHQCGPVSGISSHPFQFVWKFQSKCQQKFSIFKFITKKKKKRFIYAEAKVYLSPYCSHHINMVWNLRWEEINT